MIFIEHTREVLAVWNPWCKLHSALYQTKELTELLLVYNRTCVGGVHSSDIRKGFSVLLSVNVRPLLWILFPSRVLVNMYRCGSETLISLLGSHDAVLEPSGDIWNVALYLFVWLLRNRPEPRCLIHLCNVPVPDQLRTAAPSRQNHSRLQTHLESVFVSTLLLLTAALTSQQETAESFYRTHNFTKTWRVHER